MILVTIPFAPADAISSFRTETPANKYKKAPQTGSLVDSLQKESEEEAHAAKEAERIDVVPIKILAVEVVELCMHVL